MLSHNVNELAEVSGQVVQAVWEVRGQRQALRVIVRGDGLLRLER